jgi:hypothetical protein
MEQGGGESRPSNMSGVMTPPPAKTPKPTPPAPGSGKSALAALRTLVVDEPREVAISVGHTTVIFRPGQYLESAHLIELATIHNIRTKES